MQFVCALLLLLHLYLGCTLLLRFAWTSWIVKLSIVHSCNDTSHCRFLSLDNSWGAWLCIEIILHWHLLCCSFRVENGLRLQLSERTILFFLLFLLFFHLQVHVAQRLSLVNSIWFSLYIRVLAAGGSFFLVIGLMLEYRGWFSLGLTVFVTNETFLGTFAALSGDNVCGVLLLGYLINSWLLILNAFLLDDAYCLSYSSIALNKKVARVVINHCSLIIMRADRFLLSRFWSYLICLLRMNCLRGHPFLEELLLAILSRQSFGLLLRLNMQQLVVNCLSIVKWLLFIWLTFRSLSLNT